MTSHLIHDTAASLLQPRNHFHRVTRRLTLPMSGPTREFLIRQGKAILEGRVIIVDGVRWRVYELEPAPYDRRAGATLVFETDVVVRRVSRYPETWRGLSDVELMALSWQP